MNYEKFRMITFWFSKYHDIFEDILNIRCFLDKFKCFENNQLIDDYKHFRTQCKSENNILHLVHKTNKTIIEFPLFPTYVTKFQNYLKTNAMRFLHAQKTS